jgi:hypothetical protein
VTDEEDSDGHDHVRGRGTLVDGLIKLVGAPP